MAQAFHGFLELDMERLGSLTDFAPLVVVDELAEFELHL